MRHSTRILLAVALCVAATYRPAVAADYELSRCLIIAEKDIQISAKEAGVIVELFATRGQRVDATTALGRIDDSQPRQQMAIARAEYDVAFARAKSDVAVLYAQAAEGVARKEHEKAIEADKLVPGSVTDTEIQRLKLQHLQQTLAIEKAQLDKQIDKETVKVRVAEFNAAKVEVENRRITSPLKGRIEEVYRKAGEWVNPGDVILRVVNLEELRVDGMANIEYYNPTELMGRPVTVTVHFSKGQTHDFEGKINFVSSRVQTSGKYGVSAKVVNVQDNGDWLLRPGAKASMTIRVE